MEYSLTAREVAQAVQLTTERVRQLARDHIIEGRQAGTLWLFPASAIEAIKARPEKRGGDRRRKTAESLHAFQAPDGTWRSK